MAKIEKSIDVNVPVRTAYNQWTQFKEFPRFMEGVREVRQLDDAHLHWRGVRSGKEVEWDSEITDQVPDVRIEWRDTSGPRNAGSINFQPIDASHTKVQMVMDLEPAAPGHSDSMIAQRVGQDLARFKSMMEQQGGESGGW